MDPSKLCGASGGYQSLALTLTGSSLLDSPDRHAELGTNRAARTCASEPLVPMALFANSQFSGANLLTITLYASLSGSLFILPFVLIYANGYSAAMAGAALFDLDVGEFFECDFDGARLIEMRDLLL